MAPSSTPPPTDRAPRVREPLHARVETAAGPLRCEVHDLSLTGLFLSGVQAPVGRIVALELALGDEAPLPLQGRVVRRSRVPVDGVAITFLKTDWGLLTRVAAFLAPRLPEE